jgi:hypothetical protein
MSLGQNTRSKPSFMIILTFSQDLKGSAASQLFSGGYSVGHGTRMLGKSEDGIRRNRYEQALLAYPLGFARNQVVDGDDQDEVESRKDHEALCRATLDTSQEVPRVSKPQVT